MKMTTIHGGNKMDNNKFPKNIHLTPDGEWYDSDAFTSLEDDVPYIRADSLLETALDMLHENGYSVEIKVEGD